MVVNEELSKMTEYEKQVLCGVVKHPDANDNELSKILGIKRSTVNSIRNNLEENGVYIKKFVIPPSVFNTELISFINVQFSPEYQSFFTNNQRDEQVKIKNINSLFKDNLVFLSRSDFNTVSLHYFHNYTDFFINARKYFHNLRKYINFKSGSFFHFPREASQIISFFESGPMLEHILNLKYKDGFVGISEKQIPIRKNNNKLLSVAYLLTKNANMSSSEISKITGLSISSVDKYKKELIEKGYVLPRILVNWNKIGCNLFGFYYIRKRSKLSTEDENEMRNKIMETFKPIFAIENFVDSCGVYVTRTIEDYNKKNQFLDSLVSIKYISEDYFSTCILIKDEIESEIDFSNFMQKHMKTKK